VGKEHAQGARNNSLLAFRALAEGAEKRQGRRGEGGAGPMPEGSTINLLRAVSGINGAKSRIKLG